MTKTYELHPMVDSRKSFYGKATVCEREDGSVELISYRTKVARINPDGTAEVFGTYSNTTLRHIKDFLHQQGFEIGTKKFIEKNYIKQ